MLLLQTKEIASDDGVALDDGFAAQDDVLRAVNEAAAGDLVARVLFSCCQSGVFVSTMGLFLRGLTVSMYSPFAALGGMAGFTREQLMLPSDSLLATEVTTRC